MGGFWEPNGLQKSIKILDAFLKAKKGGGLIFLGPARRNARVPGRDIGRGLTGIWTGNCQVPGGFVVPGLARHPAVGRRIASRIPPSRFIWVVRLVSCWVVSFASVCVCARSLVCSFARSFVRSFISFARSLFRSLVRSLVPSFGVYMFVYLCVWCVCVANRT